MIQSFADTHIKRLGLERSQSPETGTTGQQALAIKSLERSLEQLDEALRENKPALALRYFTELIYDAAFWARLLGMPIDEAVKELHNIVARYRVDYTSLILKES